MMQIAKRLIRNHKISLWVLTLVGAVVFVAGAAMPAAYAVPAMPPPPDPPANNYCPAGSGPNTNYNPNDDKKDNDKPCIANDSLSGSTDPASKGCTGGEACGLINKWVNPFINFLAGAAGLIVTISIVAGGIQYARSAGDPSKVAAAKERIFNSFIALLGFLFLWTFLQWLIPGGVV